MKKKKTGSTATYFPVRTDDVHLPSPKARFALPWPSIPVIIPHRLRRKLRSRLRSRQSPASSLASLQTSLSPVDTLKSLRAHRWTVYDAQYVLLAVLAIFSLCVIASPGPLVKTGLAALITASLLLPITRQFFLPFLPIASWLILFYACRSVLPFPIALMSFADPIVGRAQVPSDGLPWPREIAQVSWRTMSKIMLTIGNSFISGEYRPPIWVRVLPALENIFYGANLSNILSAHQHVFLDVLAWLPYGIIHFGAPFVCSAIMFIFAPPGTLPVFAKSFGYMNLAGVTIQLLFPCSPPCTLKPRLDRTGFGVDTPLTFVTGYENMYGLAPANYSMEGSPAGLARVDQLFGIDLYTSSFTASPLVFGAFPSLHAGCATTEALFMSHVFPQLRPFFIGYTLWIWWATMYLSHHYAVDLIGGSLCE